MGNDCLNYITIVCHENPPQLQLLHDEQLNTENHHIVKKSKQGIIVKIWTKWNPDYDWLDGLVEKYPECWIKNEWEEEGGYAGVYVNGSLFGKKSERTSVTWNDICIEGKSEYFNKFWYKDEGEIIKITHYED